MMHSKPNAAPADAFDKYVLWLVKIKITSSSNDLLFYGYIYIIHITCDNNVNNNMTQFQYMFYTFIVAYFYIPNWNMDIENLLY